MDVNMESSMFQIFRLKVILLQSKIRLLPRQILDSLFTITGMIKYERVSSKQQLREILEIQSRAIKHNVSVEEQKSDGFITIPHTFEVLNKMNEAAAHCVALKEGKVVGYALVMLQTFRNEMDILVPMFETADQLLPGLNYLVMGQVCIDKSYRGKGVFRGLYNFYKSELADKYDCLFTEVATENKRSLQAHLAIGFKVLDTQVTDGTSWELVCWDW